VKRALPLAILAVATAVALVFALGLNGVISYALGLPSGAAVTAVQPAVAAVSPGQTGARSRERAKGKRQYIEGIMGRNIFDHTAIGVVGGPVGPTDLNVRLIATTVALPEAYSSALIAEDEKQAIPLGYGIGDKIEGSDAQVVKIEDGAVTLRRADGTEEVLAMTDAKPKRGRATKKANDDDEEVEGVADMGENKFEVERSMLDKYLGDLDAIARMGRALPHKDANGDIDGYRLSGIRRGSLAQKLGIRNGDVVHSVNGKNLSSMKEAMDAWSTLQNESSFNFDVTRRGKKVTMEYTVR
jgi:type II secretion system protein C